MKIFIYLYYFDEIYLFVWLCLKDDLKYGLVFYRLITYLNVHLS